MPVSDWGLQFGHLPISSPEAALLLVSTKNRDLWPSPTPEVRDSRTSRNSAHVQSQVWQIWLVLVSIYCVYKAIQNRNVVGLGQRSRFLVLTKRSAASGDENGHLRSSISVFYFFRMLFRNYNILPMKKWENCNFIHEKEATYIGTLHAFSFFSIIIWPWAFINSINSIFFSYNVPLLKF